MDDDSQTDDSVNSADDSPVDDSYTDTSENTQNEDSFDYSSFFDNAEDVEVEDAYDEYEDAHNAGDTNDDFDAFLDSKGMTREDLSEESQKELADADLFNSMTKNQEFNQLTPEQKAQQALLFTDKNEYQRAMIEKNALPELQKALERGDIKQEDYDKQVQAIQDRQALYSPVMLEEAEKYWSQGAKHNMSAAKDNVYNRIVEDVYNSQNLDARQALNENIKQGDKSFNTDWHLRDLNSLESVKNIAKGVSRDVWEDTKHAVDMNLGGTDERTGGRTLAGYKGSNWNNDGKTSVADRITNIIGNKLTDNGKYWVDFNKDGKFNWTDALGAAALNYGSKAGNLLGNMVAPGTSFGDTFVGSLQGIGTDKNGNKNSVGQAIGQYASNVSKGLVKDATGFLGTNVVNRSPIGGFIDGFVDKAGDKASDWLGDKVGNLAEKGIKAMTDYHTGQAVNNTIDQFFDDSASPEIKKEIEENSGNKSISKEGLQKLKTATAYDTARQNFKAQNQIGDETSVAVSDAQLKAYIVSGFAGNESDALSKLMRGKLLRELRRY